MSDNGSDLARNFLDSVTGYARDDHGATPSQDKPVRLATVDPAYTNGPVRVLFDGETIMGVREYVTLTPVMASERVALLPAGRSYIILGSLDSPSFARPMRLSFPTLIALNAFTGWPGLVGFVEADNSEYIWLTSWVVLDSGWQAFTPTLVNVTLGNGTVYARYRRRRDSVEWVVRVLLGSTSVMGSAPRISFPAAAADAWAAIANTTVAFYDASAGMFSGQAAAWSTSQCSLFAVSSSGAYAGPAAVTNAVPFVWASTDYVLVAGTFEGA